MYLVSGHAPQRLLLANVAREGEDSVPDAFEIGDVDIRKWFPRGDLRLARVSRIPGTKCALQNDFGILVMQQDATNKAKPNDAIRAQFGERWRGNVIVFKYAARDCNRVINVSPTDVSLVNAILRRYVLMYSGEIWSLHSSLAG